MKPVLFLDLDGVLANFVKGAFALHGVNRPWYETDWGMTFLKDIGKPTCDMPEFWNGMGREFWANLEWMPEGKLLLQEATRVFGRENIAILTSAAKTDGCRDGKMDWVEKNMPQYRNSVFMGTEKEKIAGPSKVLIDDYDRNAEAWRKAGGESILVPRPWNRLKDITTEGTYCFGPVVSAMEEVHSWLSK